MSEIIYLVVKNIEHINIYHKWINNPIIRKYLGVETPKTLEEIKKEWFPDKIDDNNILFEIYHKKDKIPIGLVNFYNIYHQRAEICICIGETKYWGKGIGIEAVNLMINYGFNKLNCIKMVAKVNIDNDRSLKLFEKVGFIEKRHLRRKKRKFVDGKQTIISLVIINKKEVK